MATAKMSLGSIGVVTSSANTVVSVMDAVGTSAQALAAEAQHMATKLVERY